MKLNQEEMLLESIQCTRATSYGHSVHTNQGTLNKAPHDVGPGALLRPAASPQPYQAAARVNSHHLPT